MEPRTFDADLLSEIRERWSPRAFSPEPVDPADLKAVLEAARYAPSCFNEQPWRFIVGAEEPIRRRILGVLNESNQSWAHRAPVLLLLVAETLFSETGKPNPWHAFDTGTAWGFLSLEARRRGLATHAMGGFRKAEAAEVFGLSGTQVPLAVVALGRYGDPALLTEDQQKKEAPGRRKAASELVLEGWPD